MRSGRWYGTGCHASARFACAVHTGDETVGNQRMR